MKWRLGILVLITALLLLPVAAFAGGTKETAGKAGPIATFKYWVPLAEYVATRSSNLGDIPMYKELEKRTNVHIVFSHPPAGQEQDQFNLMIASRDLPDIIEWSWISYPGGPEKAIGDKIIVPLNDLITKNAPNLKNLFAIDKQRDKLFKTDNGTYYAYPFIKSPLENGFTLVWHGPQFRKEWLDKLNLPVPTTMDEWESTLMAFKTKLNADAPLSFNWLNLPISNSFVSAYGVGIDYYQEEGKIKFGPIEPGFKDFLTTFNRWYNEGLLDPDFAKIDRKLLHSKITGGETGAFLGNAGGDMGRLYDTVKQDPNFHLVGAPYPVLKKGDRPKFGQKDFPYDTNSATAITTVNKNPDIAAKWLDYPYGTEGGLLFNFGIEGISYTMVNGQPKYTDLIMKNPDGMTQAEAMSQYSRVVYNGPFVEDVRAIKQYFPYADQISAIAVWNQADDFRRVPPVTPSPEESKQFATIMNDVKTYVDEMVVKFIMGQEPLTRYDDFVAQVKKMGIDQAIAIKQAALDRFNKR